jgi:hypothetical protein
MFSKKQIALRQEGASKAFRSQDYRQIHKAVQVIVFEAVGYE